MLLKGILSLLLVVFAQNSHADEDCSPFRLDSPGGTMEHMTTREQIGGTCFVEVATQLYDAYRFSKGVPAYSNSSGFNAALELAKHNGSNTIDNDGEGGYVCSAFDFLTKNGTMIEDLYAMKFLNRGQSFANALSGLAHQRNLYVTRMNAAQEKYSREHARTSSGYTAQDRTYTAPDARSQALMNELQSAEFMEKYGNEILEYALGMADFYVKNLYKDYDPATYREFFKQLFLRSADNEVEFFDAILARHQAPTWMRSSIRYSLPSCSATRFTALDSNRDVFDTINSKFKSGKKSLPISINVCSHLYEEGRKYQPPGIRLFGSFQGGSECGYHATLVVGRRKNPTTNRCQYLIRNTSGPNICYQKLSKDWECEEKTGSIWIDADKVAQNTGRIETIE